MSLGWHRIRAAWRRAWPEPRAPRRRLPNPRQAIPTPTFLPGRCGLCGNCCEPVDDWTCSGCGVAYPGGTFTRSTP